MSYLIIYPDLPVIETDNPTIEDFENANIRKCQIVEIDFENSNILTYNNNSHTFIDIE